MRDLPNGCSIKSTPRLVLAALCEYANNNSAKWPFWLSDAARSQVQGHLAWPSVARLAENTALSERAVQAALRTLAAAGAIRCVYRSEGGSHNYTSCYDLTPHLVSGTSARQNVVPFQSEPVDAKSDLRVNLATGTGERPAPVRVNMVHPTGERGAPERANYRAIEKELTTTSEPDVDAETSKNEPQPASEKERQAATRPDEWRTYFEEAERLGIFEPPLAPTAWPTIRKCAVRFGFSPSRFKFAVYQSGRTRGGGAVDLAINWLTLTQELGFPVCCECEDTGQRFPARTRGSWREAGQRPYCECALGMAKAVAVEAARGKEEIQRAAENRKRQAALEAETDTAPERTRQQARYEREVRAAQEGRRLRAKAIDAEARGLCCICQGENPEKCLCCHGTGKSRPLPMSPGREVSQIRMKTLGELMK